jgi:exopolysaccharide biosynthesis predicted pyruvyltransferase EpsI
MHMKRLFKLHLEPLSIIGSCGIINWPDYANSGDHFLALGTTMYLMFEQHCKIKYIGSGDNKLLESCDNIIVVGGGNFGDLWLRPYKRYTQIIEKYQDKNVYVFPVSIFFESDTILDWACFVYNFHQTGVTLISREGESFMAASKYFRRCNNILAPDAAFYLDELAKKLTTIEKDKLFLKRQDKEAKIKEKLSADYEERDWNKSAYYLSSKIVERCGQFSHHPLTSLNVLQNSISQMISRKHIVTDRLHAHILCELLCLEHEFLANSYHKNKSFYETWTKKFSNCNFRG